MQMMHIHIQHSYHVIYCIIITFCSNVNLEWSKSPYFAQPLSLRASIVVLKYSLSLLQERQDESARPSGMVRGSGTLALGGKNY